jgi:hypothetical protein
MPKCTPWSEAEDAIVATTARLSLAQVAALLPSRTVNAIRSRRSRLGAIKNRPRTPEDIAAIRRLYEDRRGHDVDRAGLAREIGRSPQWISRVAGELGLSDQHAHQRDDRGRYPSRRPKFASDDERRSHLAAVRKRHIAEHGHPRGALGMKHKPESISAMVAGAKRHRDGLTAEQRSAIARKAVMTRIERYGTAGPIYDDPADNYSRSHGGRRSDLDGRYFRSAWEANYCRYLNWLVDQWEIIGWEYEVDTFVFHGETRGAITYRPDFKVTERDGSVVYHEVKGWMDGPSKTRLARMAKHYPDVKVIVIGEDEYRAIAKWKGLIPEWEEPKDKPKRRGGR